MSNFQGLVFLTILSISVVPRVAMSQDPGLSPGSERAVEHGTRASQTKPVTIKDGRLSVDAQGRSLERLASEISDRSGVPIILDSTVAKHSVTAKFQDLSLDEGLRQILKDYDTFFFYGVDNDRPASLKGVWAYPKGKARGMAPVPPEKWASTKEFEAMLADKDPEVRGKAIETLVEREGQGALDAVLTSLHDDNDQVRTRALYGAVRAGVQVSDDVLNNLALNDPSADVRLLALQSLSNSNSQDARQIAQRALDDSSEPVRVEAREILTRLDEEANQSQTSAPSSADQQQHNQPPQHQ